MKTALVVVIIIGILLLGSVSLLPNMVRGETGKQMKFFKPSNISYQYRWHYLNQGDINTMFKGVKQGDMNMVDGHPTGFRIPSRSTVESLVGKVVVLNGVNRGPIRASVDLSKDPRFPGVGNQGQQGSCAAWAVTYYNEGWLQAYLHNWTDAHYGANKHHLMSPAWTYNKVNGGADQGSSFLGNMRVLYMLGGATMYTMPYNDQDAISWGDEAAWREAPLYRIMDGGILNVSAIINATTGTLTPPTPQQVENLTNAIKSMLSKGYPVNFAIDADEYDTIFQNGGNYIISYSEYDANGSINHAQTIVGYNDSISDNGDQGAFKVVNSWGTGWGDNGYYWITYKAMYKILAMGQGYPYGFVMFPRYNYEPKLLAVWTVDPNNAGTRITPIDLGIGSPSNPIQIENSVFGNITSANGGDHPFPTFLAVDLTDFMGNFSYNSSNEFFLYAHKWSKKMIITSFHIEYYPNTYIPGEPYQVSDNSPDVPAVEDSSHNAIVRGYLRPIQHHTVIKINSNADFTPQNGVVGGSGTQADPWIIGWWDIDAQGGEYSIYIGNTTDYFVVEKCYLHNATVNNGAGIYLQNVTNGYIFKNKIYNNYYGISFTTSYLNTLAENEFFNNTRTMFISYSLNPRYYNQTIYSNNTVNGKPMYYIYNKTNYVLGNLNVGYVGVVLSNHVTLQNIILNNGDEIYMEGVNNVSLLDSRVSNTLYGLTMVESSYVNVSGNYFVNNTYGLETVSLQGSVIENNTFLYNAYGVTLVSSDNNVIYHNNFVGNGIHASDTSANNQWYKSPPIGGNYWDNYTGVDNNGDGFGDTPYNISGPGNEKDMYPLMKPWDTIPPQINISTPTNGKIFGVSSVTVYWNGTDNTGIDHYNVSIDNSGEIDVGLSTNYTFKGIHDGTHTVYVTAYDFSGNHATDEVSFTVDTTPPVITILSPQDGSYLNTSNVTLTWSVNDATSVGFMISVDGGMWSSLGSVTQYTVHNLKEGSHKIDLMGMDAAGNTATAEIHITVDTIPPDITIVSPENGTYVNTTNVMVIWSVNDTSSVKFNVSVDNGNWISVGNSTQYTLNGLNEGTHIVEIEGIDEAGNTATVETQFIVDTRAPYLNITSPANNSVVNKSSIVVMWNVSDPTLKSVFLWVDNENPQNVTGLYSKTLNLTDGIHKIYVKAGDSAGHTTIRWIIVTVDTTPPSITQVTPNPGTKINKTSIEITIIFSEKVNNSTLKYHVTGGKYNISIAWKANFTELVVTLNGLESGKTYHFVIDSLEDMAGNHMSSYDYSFTTSSPPPAPKPKSTSQGGNNNALIIGSVIAIIIILIIVGIVLAMKKKGGKGEEETSEEETEELEESKEKNESEGEEEETEELE